MCSMRYIMSGAAFIPASFSCKDVNKCSGAACRRAYCAFSSSSRYVHSKQNGVKRSWTGHLQHAGSRFPSNATGIGPKDGFSKSSITYVC